MSGRAEITAPLRVPSVGRRVRGSLGNSASSLATSIVAYLVIGRFVDPAEYGRAAVVLAVWGLLSMPIECTGGLLMRYGPVELSQRGTLGTSISTRLVFALPPLLLLLPGAPIYLAWARGWPGWLVALTIPWLLLSTVFSVTQWSGIAAQRFGVLTAASVLQRSTPIAAVLILCATHTPVRAPAMILATLVGVVLGVAVPLVLLGRLLAPVRPDRALLTAMWRYSLPSLIVMPLEAALTYVDPLVLVRYVPHADVGRYQLAYAVINLFGMLGASLNSVLSPELVRASASGDGHVVEVYRRRDQPRFAVLLGLGAFGAACLSGPVVRAVLPDRFAAAGELVAVLTVAGGFMIGVWSLYPLATVTDSVWALHSSLALGALTNVVLDFAWAPIRGTIGVAEANVTAWAVNFVVLVLLLRRRVHARAIGLVVLLPAGGLVMALLLIDGVSPWLRSLTGVALLALGAAGTLSVYRRKKR